MFRMKLIATFSFGNTKTKDRLLKETKYNCTRKQNTIFTEFYSGER